MDKAEKYLLCGDCRFFEGFPYHHPIGEPHDYHGSCHRYPEKAWVSEHYWCGEFEMGDSMKAGNPPICGSETPPLRLACPHGDLSCPCPDGLACRYEGLGGWMLEGESYDDLAQVCTAHKRFVPCRTRDGCHFSTNPADVEAVRTYQRGTNADPA